MAFIVTNIKILLLEVLLITLVSSAPHGNGINDQSSIATTTTTALKTALTTVFALGTIVSLAIVFFGCICCQHQRFKVNSSSSQSNGIPLPQHHSNNLESGNNASEFAIFPPPHAILKQPVNQNDDSVTFEPLPDIRLRKFSSPVASGYFPKPAYFSSDVNKGLSLHDWFDDPQSNFPRSQLQYFSEVGSGWFGQVVEGEAQQITPEEKKTQVVVKILREDASPSEHIYFLHEVRLFRDLRHPNIMRLLGRCLEVDPFLIILEHCHMDLKTYLIQHRSNPESILQGGQLLRAACHVAKGLNHMHEHNFIHTDLAARNCLVGHDRSVKIGDYGISVNAFKEDYYCVGGIALPIRWCSPESLVYSDNAIRTKELTTEANIWSFGVLLWEMIELGKLPYMEFSDDEVLQKTITEQSLMLERPKTPCLHKDQLYQVMRLCWNCPQNRPSIQKISSLLEHLFENKDVASDSIAFETRWNALQPVIREHNLSPKSMHDPHSIALTFESDFVPNNPIQKLTKNDNFLSSDFDVSSLRETSSSRCSLTQSFEANFGATISPSLQNLRGSLEDLALRNNSLERERKWDPLNVTNNPNNYNNKVNENKSVMAEDDKVINDQICEAIKDLDEFLAGEVTSSEVSKDTTPERNESGDEDEVDLKNDFVSKVKLGKSEFKNGSATTLTDVGTETGETLPKDSSDDSLHGHLLSDLDRQEIATPTNDPDPIWIKNKSQLSPESESDHAKPIMEIPKEQQITSEAIIHAPPVTQNLNGNVTETEATSTYEADNISGNSQTSSPIQNFPEKESHRDSAIVLESESSSSISSKTDEICLSNSPVNEILINKLSSQNLDDKNTVAVEEVSTEEYVSTNASPSRALLNSFASDSSALLNEPLITRGNPGSTAASMANRGGNNNNNNGDDGGSMASASETTTNSSTVTLPLLTQPVKIPSHSDDAILTQIDCGFRSELISSDANDPNNTSSTNNYLSLSLDSLDAISNSPCKPNILITRATKEECSFNDNDTDDVMEGCTDDMEHNILSDSDLESLGEGYECSPLKTRKTSTPNKEHSKPSVSLSESSLGQTYYTACDQSHLDESLKLEETSVLPFIEITLCEDIETDTIFDTCHSETPTLNEDPNSDTDNMNSESFEDQVGFLGQDSDGNGGDREYIEAVNSELVYRLTQSTPSDQSPSMLSLPSSENLKFDRDCFNETLFMRTDEGNCRPNYKNQLASFAFQKELNGISFAREFQSLNSEKPPPPPPPQFVTNYDKNRSNSLILNNVFEQSNPEMSSDSFAFKSGHRRSYDSSYLNSDFEQSNPEVTSNSLVFVNSNHTNSWFQPPPQYRECDNYERTSYYDEEESIVEDISEEFGAQAPKYQNPLGIYRNQEYQLEDILACLDDANGGTDNPAYNEDDVETNPSIFSPVEDSGKYSSMADEDDNSIILDDVNQGAHCSDELKDYLDDEVLIVDTETNEAVMLDSKERLTLAMEEENLAFYERQLYVNEVYDPDNYYGPTKLESIVEEFEENSNATSPAYSGNSNLSDDPSPERSFDHSGLQMKINDYGFNSQEELDKSISEACSCVVLSEDEDEDDECSTNFGARSVDSLENSPQIKINPPVLILEGEEYLAGAETDDGFNDYDVEEPEEDENSSHIERPGTSMLLAKQFQDFHSQSPSETDEEDFISPKEKRDEVYTPDFDSDTDETSSTGTSESSTSGSFECSNDALEEEEDVAKSSTPLQSPLKSSSDTTPTSPVKIFSTAWDCTITPTKSAIKSPEKKSGDMKKSVSFHEEGPAYIFSYPPESDSDDDEGNEEAPEFTWHVDYSSYADWDFQPIDDEEIPEDIVEIDDLDSPQPTPLAPVNLSSIMYSITDISDDDMLDSLDSQSQMRIDNGSLVNFGYPEMTEVNRSTEDDLDARRVWLNYAVEEKTMDNFQEGQENWPADDFPEIVTSPDDNADNILETVNPFIMDLSMELPNVHQSESDCDQINLVDAIDSRDEVGQPSDTLKTVQANGTSWNELTHVELQSNSATRTTEPETSNKPEDVSTTKGFDDNPATVNLDVLDDKAKHEQRENVQLPDICKDLFGPQSTENQDYDEEVNANLVKTHKNHNNTSEQSTSTKLKINQSIFNEGKTLISPVEESTIQNHEQDVNVQATNSLELTSTLVSSTVVNREQDTITQISPVNDEPEISDMNHCKIKDVIEVVDDRYSDLTTDQKVVETDIANHEREFYSQDTITPVNNEPEISDMNHCKIKDVIEDVEDLSSDLTTDQKGVETDIANNTAQDTISQISPVNNEPDISDINHCKTKDAKDVDDRSSDLTTDQKVVETDIANKIAQDTIPQISPVNNEPDISDMNHCKTKDVKEEVDDRSSDLTTEQKGVETDLANNIAQDTISQISPVNNEPDVSDINHCKIKDVKEEVDDRSSDLTTEQKGVETDLANNIAQDTISQISPVNNEPDVSDINHCKIKDVKEDVDVRSSDLITDQKVVETDIANHERGNSQDTISQISPVNNEPDINHCKTKDVKEDVDDRSSDLTTDQKVVETDIANKIAQDTISQISPVNNEPEISDMNHCKTKDDDEEVKDLSSDLTTDHKGVETDIANNIQDLKPQLSKLTTKEDNAEFQNVQMDSPQLYQLTTIKEKLLQNATQLSPTGAEGDIFPNDDNTSPKIIHALDRDTDDDSEYIEDDSESQDDLEHSFYPHRQIFDHHLDDRIIGQPEQPVIGKSLQGFNVGRAFHVPSLPQKNFGISPLKRVNTELGYNLNERKDIVQDIPLEIDEILFEMERSFSMSDIAIASPEPVPLPEDDQYKTATQTNNEDKKRSLLKFREESLSFEGESSESKSSGTGSSLPKLNDSSPALSSDIDICESDLEDTKEINNQSDKYLIENNHSRDFIECTDTLLNTSEIVNGNFLSHDKDTLNFENNNEGRERFLHEVVNKDLANKYKMDNKSTNQETISS